MANHPDHDKQLPRLRRVEGQVRGIQTMISERRYCVDILTQLRALEGAVQQVEKNILEDHLNHCVQQALIQSDPEAAQQKIQEIVKLLKK
ncbi:MAG: metal-sensitive transcriptional regulator [SAR324 cluster bacterium]|jgi:CsoR family transcriptional regulator, copper-sensing transcriptional repressor|nr:metal-sensitive transcriptional regulator [SAR324 cluster bacterium]